MGIRPWPMHRYFEWLDKPCIVLFFFELFRILRRTSLNRGISATEHTPTAPRLDNLTFHIDQEYKTTMKHIVPRDKVSMLFILGFRFFLPIISIFVGLEANQSHSESPWPVSLHKYQDRTLWLSSLLVFAPQWNICPPFVAWPWCTVSLSSRWSGIWFGFRFWTALRLWQVWFVDEGWSLGVIVTVWHFGV
jgi:hypothetical protein